mmetsp:Transcript_19602/g.55098  ORF Transcript_19602/g.55098 Transcript_19602/m.55098 type:complete len:173 (-) Transcript_19602:234-752(-)
MYEKDDSVMGCGSRRIRVETGIRCSDGIVRYRIVVDNEGVAVKRFNDFKALDMGLRGCKSTPALPTAGILGVLGMLDWHCFNEFRRSGLESYLCDLCAGACSSDALKFLAVREEDLRMKSVEEIQLYSSAELREHGFTAAQLHARGRNARGLACAGFRLEELSAAGYRLGTF